MNASNVYQKAQNKYGTCIKNTPCLLQKTLIFEWENTEYYQRKCTFETNLKNGVSPKRNKSRSDFLIGVIIRIGKKTIPNHTL